MQIIGTPKTVIVKVTHTCNLNCKYCCVGDVIDHHIISEDTLDNLFKKLADDGKESTIIWHGGEPLVAGLPFYKRAVELQKKYPGHVFKNSLQTNGTLLTDEYLDFFQENDFSLGFSLDGCKISHNINRPFKGGKDSFDFTFKWYKEVERRGMHPGAICVINANTARYIKEIYDFAKQSKIAFKFNPQYPAGRATLNVDLGLDNKRLSKAYIELFDLWFDDNPDERVFINMFDNFVDGIIKISNNETSSINGYDCAWANRCQKSFIGLATNGDVYPCGKFVDEPEFLYGNINEEKSLAELLDNNIRKKFLVRHEKGVSDCVNCRYLPICSSGCPHTAHLFTNSLSSKNPFCESNILLFEHIEKRLIEKFKRADIYIENTDESKKEYLVYSPLRKGCFLVGNEARHELEDYIKRGVLPKNEELSQRLDQWAHQLPMSLKHYNLDIYNTSIILLTQKCNLSCSYCYAKNSRSSAVAKKEDVKAIVDQVLGNRPNSNKLFSFIGGGEPTVNWDLLTWSIDYIRKNQRHENVIITITTNGTLLDEERIIWLKQHKVEVGLSYDILPDIQNRLRAFSNGAGSYEVVDTTIKLLHKHNLYFRIRATVTEDSVTAMPEMIAYIRDNYPYIKHVQLEPVQDKGQYKKTYYDKFVEGFIQAYIVGRQCGIDVYNMITHSIGTIKSQFCRGEFCLTPEGRIVSCQRFSSDKDELFSKFEFGKVLNGKVEIDNNSYKQVASMFSSKLPQCETCFVKYNCAGMCTAVRSDLAEEQVSEYCNFIKNLVKQMLLTYNM